MVVGPSGAAPAGASTGTLLPGSSTSMDLDSEVPPFPSTASSAFADAAESVTSTGSTSSTPFTTARSSSMGTIPNAANELSSLIPEQGSLVFLPPQLQQQEQLLQQRTETTQQEVHQDENGPTAFSVSQTSSTHSTNRLLAATSSTSTSSSWQGFTVSEALLLGAILSATDPVAVIGALHNLHAPAKLTLLISGEALLNDGSGVLLFLVFLDLAKGLKPFSFTDVTFQFAYLAFGGIFVGIISFCITLFLLRNVTKNAGNINNNKESSYQVGLFIVIVGAYGTFFVADHHDIEVSAVLAIVTFGFAMSATGQYSIAGEHAHSHHTVIAFLALVSNELIFVLAGVVGYRYSFQANLLPRDWIELIVLYFLVHLTRAIVVAVLYPFLKRSGYGMTMKECIILVYSGLRGAVGLAMAILVESDTSSTVLPLETRARIAFHVSGIALLTIFINGTTITPLYHYLSVYDSAKHHSLLLHRALCQAEILSKAQQKQMQKHWFFHNCNFEILDLLIPQLHRIFKSSDDAIARNLTADNKSQITDKRVQRLMMQLASMLNVEKESRYRAKIEFASEFSSVRGLSLCTQREMLNASDLRNHLYPAGTSGTTTSHSNSAGAIAQQQIMTTTMSQRKRKKVKTSSDLSSSGAEEDHVLDLDAAARNTTMLLKRNSNTSSGHDYAGRGRRGSTSSCASVVVEGVPLKKQNYTTMGTSAPGPGAAAVAVQGVAMIHPKSKKLHRPGIPRKSSCQNSSSAFSASKTPLLCWSGKKKNFEFPLKSNASVLQGLRSNKTQEFLATGGAIGKASSSSSTSQLYLTGLDEIDSRPPATSQQLLSELRSGSRSYFEEDGDTTSRKMLNKHQAVDVEMAAFCQHAGRSTASIREHGPPKRVNSNENVNETDTVNLHVESSENDQDHPDELFGKRISNLIDHEDLPLDTVIASLPSNEPRTLRSLIRFFNKAIKNQRVTKHTEKLKSNEGPGGTDFGASSKIDLVNGSVLDVGGVGMNNNGHNVNVGACANINKRNSTSSQLEDHLIANEEMLRRSYDESETDQDADITPAAHRQSVDENVGCGGAVEETATLNSGAAVADVFANDKTTSTTTRTKTAKNSIICKTGRNSAELVEQDEIHGHQESSSDLMNKNSMFEDHPELAVSPSMTMTTAALLQPKSILQNSTRGRASSNIDNRGEARKSVRISIIDNESPLPVGGGGEEEVDGGAFGTTMKSSTRGMFPTRGGGPRDSTSEMSEELLQNKKASTSSLLVLDEFRRSISQDKAARAGGAGHQQQVEQQRRRNSAGVLLPLSTTSGFNGTGPQAAHAVDTSNIAGGTIINDTNLRTPHRPPSLPRHRSCEQDRIGRGSGRLRGAAGCGDGSSPDGLQKSGNNSDEDDNTFLASGSKSCNSNYAPNSSNPHNMSNTISMLNVRQAITADIETAAELYQTILDASFAGYSELYELQVISELTYRALMEAFEYAQEAVQGELQEYCFLTNGHFPELHLQPHRVQCEASLEVFWDCLLHCLSSGVGLRWKFSNWLHGDSGSSLCLAESTSLNDLQGAGAGGGRATTKELMEGADDSNAQSKNKQQLQKEKKAKQAKASSQKNHNQQRRWFKPSESSLLRTKWDISKRHFEAIFAFIIVNETLIEELPVFDDFPHIKNTVNHLLEAAMAEKLYQLHKQSPEMFIMLEHILAARLLLINKSTMLQHLTKEGVLKQADVEHILDSVMEPSFVKLTTYNPDGQVIEIMRQISNPGIGFSF
ncbi:unnamed protein product [Amoebophrya sp. A120]|nr:unnamed protein product [Amoebophrya sp. A120]|eukprot:GSA120T00015551001.1